MTLAEMSGAEFSECGTYRRLLWRIWDQALPLLLLIMLNPSKAGAVESDPTVTRQIERAKRLRCGGLLVANAYDLVSTDPRALKTHPMPLSDANDGRILYAAERAIRSGGMIIVAWGKNCAARRQSELAALLDGMVLHSLAVNADGSPAHPLYIGYDVQPQRWLA